MSRIRQWERMFFVARVLCASFLLLPLFDGKWHGEIVAKVFLFSVTFDCYQ